MTKRNLLFLFVCAGLIFALIAGVYVYRLNRPPGPEEAQELLRTFIGRILRLEFSNPKVRRTWQDDMRALARAYGEEDDHAVQ